MKMLALKFVFTLMIVKIVNSNLVSEEALNLNEDLNVSNAKTDSITESTTPLEPNILQKIRLPVGGPYCYPEMLKPIDHSITAPPRTTRYTPQMRDESEELMELRYPEGVTENIWPYEQKQSEREREIRKYFRLNVSPEWYEEADRFTGKSAERAFISRYYGFINSVKNKKEDDLIKFIEDEEKLVNHFALKTDPDPLRRFNSLSEQKKSKFCEKFINYSVILFEQNVNFVASRSNEIRRQRVSLKYKNTHLLTFHETLEVVICPCKNTSDNTPIELGVLPIRYKFKKEFPYAFIYDITKKSKNGSNEVESIEEVTVRALTKIDIDGIAEERKTREAETQGESSSVLSETNQKKEIGQKENKGEERGENSEEYLDILRKLFLSEENKSS